MPLAVAGADNVHTGAPVIATLERLLVALADSVRVLPAIAVIVVPAGIPDPVTVEPTANWPLVTTTAVRTSERLVVVAVPLVEVSCRVVPGEIPVPDTGEPTGNGLPPVETGWMTIGEPAVRSPVAVGVPLDGSQEPYRLYRAMSKLFIVPKLKPVVGQAVSQFMWYWLVANQHTPGVRLPFWSGVVGAPSVAWSLADRNRLSESSVGTVSPGLDSLSKPVDGRRRHLKCCCTSNSARRSRTAPPSPLTARGSGSSSRPPTR